MERVAKEIKNKIKVNEKKFVNGSHHTNENKGVVVN